jgi:hypothetical protein
MGGWNLPGRADHPYTALRGDIGYRPALPSTSSTRHAHPGVMARRLVVARLRKNIFPGYGGGARGGALPERIFGGTGAGGRAPAA